MEKIKGRAILEMLGRPKEHLIESFNMLLERLSKEKGIVILEKTVHEPLPVENSKDLFSSFAELILEFEAWDNYFGFVFGYMPANIEIISPESVSIRKEDFTLLGNRLLIRLHDYDAITKRVLRERELLVNKLKEVAPHLFKKKDSQEQTPKEEIKKETKKKKAKKSKS